MVRVKSDEDGGVDDPHFAESVREEAAMVVVVVGPSSGITFVL